ADDSGTGFRLITYNVWYGFTQVPKRKTAYLEWIRDQAPDIVCLQELNGYTQEKLSEDASAWGHSYSVLLKTEGFPTGITSRDAIEDIQRTFDGFHHGLLRVRIRGMYVYVIHLHPSNWEARLRESVLILKDVASLPKESEVILAGDFNTFSSDDAKYYQHGQLEPFFSERDEMFSEKNLRDGQLDYSVIERFKKAGLTDLENSMRDEDFVFSGSFPTKIEKTGEDGSARRLDYVFASSGLAGRTTRAETIASEKTWTLSDHLPVIVDFMQEDVE
ncbi:MAG: endonuclease/exonuclease/phosphatase family protein, partial [Planctomycetales bacterium]|nr:endonuclease/exonuclease/phosphatase family protein [Planctomycetales bacterium]